MGRRGPPKEPDAVKLAKGTYRADRDGDLSLKPQPEVITDMPPAPDALGDAGRQRWSEDGARLLEIGVLTVVDLPAFELYCRAWDELAMWDAELAEHGHDFSTVKGFICQRPAVARREKALDRIRRYQQEFGMTASSRSSLTTAKPKAGGIKTRKRA